MRVLPYVEAEHREPWDAWCAAAPEATLLHTRRFLSYHGSRFDDRSLVIEEGGRWLGVLPAAVHPTEPAVVVSHPGATYGGLVHGGALRGEAALQALRLAARHYAGQGHQRLQYKAVPHIYHRAPMQDDLYALFRLGARRCRCDLSSCIDLAHRLPTSERRRRGAKKAARAGLRYAEGLEHAGGLWTVLQDNLARRHGARPVHTLEELQLLAQRFPQHITLHVALLGEAVLAGLVLFRSPTVVHAQYIAASEAGHECSALDGLFEQVIAQAAASGVRYFDFGISNEDQGRVLNEGLHRFKSEFGAGGVVHEFYELDLHGDQAVQ